jgi:hypothetical protein
MVVPERRENVFVSARRNKMQALDSRANLRSPISYDLNLPSSLRAA